MPEFRVGDVVEGWYLSALLGRGGNARVWRATRASVTAALKILNRFDTQSEPFKRFKAEVDVLRSIGGHEGILPVLDWSLPDRPTQTRPAWLAMPEATLVRERLGAEPDVDETVRCHQSIASTLADLQERFGVFHRDVKPQNMYWFDGRWCLGDFGLVEYPDMAGLTRPGTWVGPVNYLAPEMLLNPDGAAPGPVDVYALAKTLWTILARLPVPIPGPLDRRLEACRITNYVRDERLNSIEQLLDRATRHEPAERPPMSAIAAELNAWLRPQPTVASTFDTAALRQALGPVVSRHISTAKAYENLWNDGHALLTSIETQLQPLRTMLQEVLGIPVGLAGDNRVSNVPGIHKWFEQPGQKSYAAVSLWARGEVPFGGGSAVELYGGVALFFTSSLDRIALAAGYAIHYDGQHREIWSAGDSVVPGSATAQALVADLIDGLFTNAETAVRAFVETLPG